MSKRKKFEITATTFDRRGRFIARGENDYKKSHPIMFNIGVKVGQPEKIFLHAEVSALLKGKTKLPYLIVIQRYDIIGNMALSRPCSVCMEALRIYGVSKIKYTTKNGWMEETL